MPSKLQKLQLNRIFPKIFRRIIISELKGKKVSGSILHSARKGA